MAACSSVEVVETSDVDPAWVTKEREALLEQAFIKNDKKLVKDVVKEVAATLGENVRVRRFTRFNLGEGIEKKVSDFAAEVAAAAGQA